LMTASMRAAMEDLDLAALWVVYPLRSVYRIAPNVKVVPLARPRPVLELRDLTVPRRPQPAWRTSSGSRRKVRTSIWPVTAAVMRAERYSRKRSVISRTDATSSSSRCI
jgi:hypothetical protein